MKTHWQNQLKISVLAWFKLLYRIKYKDIDVILVQCPFKQIEWLHWLVTSFSFSMTATMYVQSKIITYMFKKKAYLFTYFSFPLCSVIICILHFSNEVDCWRKPDLNIFPGFTKLSAEHKLLVLELCSFHEWVVLHAWLSVDFKLNLISYQPSSMIPYEQGLDTPLCQLNGSQLAKMKKYISHMSLPWNL